MRRRILVADDSATIQKVIKIAFARFPLDIIEAASHLEALAAIGQGIPDALILDASLPGARGAQDFIKLRAEAGGAPVLVLIGSYESVDEAALAQAGFSHVLKKPFESSDIIAEIERLLGIHLAADRPPPPVPTVAPTQPPAPGAWGGPANSAGGILGGGLPLVTPPLPGVHGNTDRSQHATVVHSGGFPGLDRDTTDDEDADERGRGTSSGVANSPAIEQGLRGRRAFGSDGPGIPPFNGGISGTGRPMPPPPGGPANPPGNSGAYAVPPPPLRLDLDDFADDTPESAVAQPEPARRSSVPSVAPRSSPPPVPPTEGGILDEVLRGGGVAAAELPAWVRQAVEDYCERHFKSLAREVITLELRRLADEKARHLVDN